MAFPSASATLVPRALALVKQRFPDIDISFTEAEPPESIAALRAGECDLAIAFAYEGTDLARGEEDLDAFVITPLLEDEVRLAVPRTHPVADQRDRAARATWRPTRGSPAARGAGATSSSSPTPRASAPTSRTRPRTTSRSWAWSRRASASRSSPTSSSARCTTPTSSPCRWRPASRRTITAMTTSDLGRVPAVKATLEALIESAGSQSRAPTTRMPDPAWSI